MNKKPLPEGLEGFIQLLEKAQPKFKEIEVIFHNEGIDEMLSCVIFADGNMKYMLERQDKDKEEFLREIRSKVEQLKNPPRFWRGCRVDLAKYLGYYASDLEFKAWFKKYSKMYKDLEYG